MREQALDRGLSQTLEMAAKVVGSDRTFRGEPSLKTVPIRPFLGLLTNFATGPLEAPAETGRGRDSGP